MDQGASVEVISEDKGDGTEFHASGSGAADAGREALVRVQLRRHGRTGERLSELAALLSSVPDCV